MIIGASERPIWARIARITRARGLRGDVIIVPDQQEAPRTWEGARVFLSRGEGPMIPKTVLRVGGTAGRLAIRLTGIVTREAAESIVGSDLYVPRNSLPALPPETYYHVDLMGASVWGVEGQQIGRLINILQAGGADVLVVEGPGGEHLIPATKEVVLEVNPGEGYLIVSPLYDH